MSDFHMKASKEVDRNRFFNVFRSTPVCTDPMKSYYNSVVIYNIFSEDRRYLLKCVAAACDTNEISQIKTPIHARILSISGRSRGAKTF